MSDLSHPETELANLSEEERTSALFAQMVMQQTNMAMMLLGQVPHPQSGETVKDLEAARMFIDQLEMLEKKTKGNLSPPEERFLQQSLVSLRMTFVEATQESPSAPAQPSPTEPSGAVNPIVAPEDESKKKFSKKY